MEKRDEALLQFSSGFNCAQSVLAAFCAAFDVDNNIALRIAGAFGGGIAGTGETCGAVAGGLMVIGLRHGMTDPKDLQAKEKTRDLGKRFIQRFSSAHGSCRCKELLGCDVATPEGAEKARADGLFKTLCPRFVGGAADILEELL